jgi:tRNA1Val (adenine37-N6)-methyltransferase
MSNSFFKFKQFTIHQDKCAMKVSTDACIFGAEILLNNNAQNILDIGAGTGLLSLMQAQKKEQLKITAIEINEDAYLQAKQNFEDSKFANQIQIVKADIIKYESAQKFDVIICNPPFFENDLKTVNKALNDAKHSDALSLSQLINCIKNLLNNDGEAFLILPTFRKTELEI